MKKSQETAFIAHSVEKWHIMFLQRNLEWVDCHIASAK